MMFSRVLTDILPCEIDRGEVIRYAGGGKDCGELAKMLDECIAEASSVLSYRGCYKEFDINTEREMLDLGFCKVKSASLAKNLSGCKKIILFAATVGMGIDRLIMKYGKISPAKGLMMQAIGAERVEALCDAFSEKLKEKGYEIRPRFSPGYGDLPISLQKEIFASLQPEKLIGLTLSDSLLMSPTKSVTAIIGIK